MKKIAYLLLVGVLLMGCGNDKVESPEVSTNIETEKDTVVETEKNEVVEEETKEEVSALDAFKVALQDAGLEVGDNQLVAFELLGATNGYKFEVNGELLEVYEFAEDNEMRKQAENGSVNMSGFNVPIMYSDELGICRVEQHSNKDEIVEVFNNFR